MRMLFGVLGLLLVVAIVGVLAKKQLGAASGPVQVVPGAASPTAATPQQQVQQAQQAVQDAMRQAQQARPMPDEK